MNTNQVLLQGRLAGDPTFVNDYEVIFPIAIKRLSGTEDKIMIHTSVFSLPKNKDLRKNDALLITGSLETNNYYSADGKRHLMIYIRARLIEFSPISEKNKENYIYCNDVTIQGNVCTIPNKRITPFGKHISDMTIASCNAGKSIYIPCIIWNRLAEWASHEIEVGDEITVDGRLQSREYVKVHENGECEERTAYELSIFNICKTGYNNKRSNA